METSCYLVIYCCVGWVITLSLMLVVLRCYHHTKTANIVLRTEIKRLKAVLSERTLQVEETYKKLVKAKKQWEKTFDALPDLITIMDVNHRIVKANKATIEALNREPGELVGEHCYKLVHGTFAPPEYCPAINTFKDHKSHSAQACLAKLNGEFVLSTHPIFTSEKKFIGCVHVARDVTDLIKVQRDLEEKQTQLHTLEIAKTKDLLDSARSLNAGIAHELRTPLQAILNSLELVAEGVGVLEGQESVYLADITPGELKELLTDAEDRLLYSMKVLDSLSVYAKAGVSKATHLINVVSEIEMIMRTLRFTDKFKFLESDAFTLKFDCDPVIKLNSSDFIQVITNLCNNAVEAVGHTNPKIDIRVTCIGRKEVIIQIIDNGCGLDSSLGTSIFEPYFSTKGVNPAGGLTNHGLGLAIVKNIVRSNAGNITYTSQPGLTDFSVSFPCV